MTGLENRLRPQRFVIKYAAPYDVEFDNLKIGTFVFHGGVFKDYIYKILILSFFPGRQQTKGKQILSDSRFPWRNITVKSKAALSHSKTA